MNTFNRILGAFLAAVVLASAVPVITTLASGAPEAELRMPASPADHGREAEKYEQEALELDAKAKRHAEMAKHYRARESAGSKHATALQSLIAHCERLTRIYAEAAAEAREMAKSHRAMAQTG
jgi:hypothetical protein